MDLQNCGFTELDKTKEPRFIYFRSNKSKNNYSHFFSSINTKIPNPKPDTDTAFISVAEPRCLIFVSHVKGHIGEFYGCRAYREPGPSG